MEKCGRRTGGEGKDKECISAIACRLSEVRRPSRPNVEIKRGYRNVPTLTTRRATIASLPALCCVADECPATSGKRRGRYPSFCVGVSDRPRHDVLTGDAPDVSDRKEQDRDRRGRLILVHGRLPDVWCAHDQLRSGGHCSRRRLLPRERVTSRFLMPNG